MSYSPWFVVAAWVVVGLVTAVVMRRRGHALFAWSVLGVFFGPLTIPLATDHVRRERRLTRPVRRSRGGAGRQVSALVGLDGSKRSETALGGIIDALGGALDRVTLARVVDFETADLHGAPESRAQRNAVMRDLRAQVARLRATHPETNANATVLAGRPADALIAEAERGGYDMIVVGVRGRGASKALLGSTADRLVRRSPVPVLVIGDRSAAAGHGAFTGSTRLSA